MAAATECGARCFAERRAYCRDLSKWSRNLLYFIGSGGEDWSAEAVCPVCEGKRRCHNAMDVESLQEDTPVSSRPAPSAPDDAQPKEEQPKTLNFDFLWTNGGDADQENQNAYVQQFSHLNPFLSISGGNSLNAYQQLMLAAMLGGGGGSGLYHPAFSLLSPPALHQSSEDSAATAAALGLNLSKPSPAKSSSAKAAAVESSAKTRSENGSGSEEPLDLSKKSTAAEDLPPPFQPASASGVQDFLSSNGVAVLKAPAAAAQANKRNYSQADLEKAVDDIRSKRLGTRRASVVYGIPRSTLRNKIYKLEAAEENGPGDEGTLDLSNGSGGGTNGSVKGDEEEKPLNLSSDIASLVSNPATSANSYLTTLLAQQMMREKRGLLGISSGGLAWGPGQGLTPEQASWLQSAYAPLLGSLWGQEANVLRLVSSAETESNARLSAEKTRGSKSPSKTPTTMTRRDSDDSSTPVPNFGDNPRSTNTPKDWNRKARPKRGQYRKYDKNALDEAVRSVRSGEMSVHRAGSFYGVPHSTLEYKVKERNLLRTKKRKAEEGCVTPNTPNTPSTPALKSEDDEAKVKMEKSEESAWNLSSDMMKRLKEAAATENPAQILSA